jgi:APA family basic amino acid/polyamine antiporter
MSSATEAVVAPGQVRRRIGPFTATSIVVANMIGAGIFTTSGIVASQVPGPAWVLGCWVFGGLIAVSGALCYAELATRMPEEGGEYVYLKKIYHPALGFLTGWTSFLAGFSAPIAASALGFSAYIFSGMQQRFPGLSDANLLALKKGSAVAIILTLTVVHYLGVRFGSIVQNFLTGMKIIIVFGLASIGLAMVPWQGKALAFSNGDPVGSFAFGTAMMFVMFAYSGWNASAYIAGELKEPHKTLPLSLLLGTGIVIFLYLAVNLFILQSVPFQALKGMEEAVKEASIRAFGDWTGNILGFMVGIALLSSLSAYIILGPRVYYAMARDRLFLPIAARVHPRFGVPGVSIMIQGGIAILMVITGTLDQIMYYVGFALGIFPWLAVIGLFLARRRQIGESTAAKVWGYPIVPAFYLVSSLGLMVVAFINRPFASSIALISIGLGIPCYYLWIKSVNNKESV